MDRTSLHHFWLREHMLKGKTLCSHEGHWRHRDLAVHPSATPETTITLVHEVLQSRLQPLRHCTSWNLSGATCIHECAPLQVTIEGYWTCPSSVPLHRCEGKWRHRNVKVGRVDGATSSNRAAIRLGDCATYLAELSIERSFARDVLLQTTIKEQALLPMQLEMISRSAPTL